jgi:hypothetical protein
LHDKLEALRRVAERHDALADAVLVLLRELDCGARHRHWPIAQRLAFEAVCDHL